MAEQTLSQTRPATAAQAAALHFEPWREGEGWTPPTDSEWSSLMRSHLTTLRAGCVIMRKTKDQLTSAIDTLDDEAGNTMMEAFDMTAGYFEALAEIMRSVQTRLIVAGSVLEVDDAEG